MDQKIENIIKELYALDPILRERDKDIRAFVVSLIELRPEISVDKNFVIDLRARLASRKFPVTPKMNHDFSWWVIRFVPLGAIAILILVFLPELTKPAPYGTPIAPSAFAPSETEEASDQEFFRGLSEPASTDAFSAPADSGKSLTMMAVSINSINVSSQNPGSVVTVGSVELEKPGFAVVYADKAGAFGEVVGNSLALPAGGPQRVQINLSRPMREGEVFYAALHTEDGDGVFDAEKDAPIFDAITGSPMYMIFTVENNSPEFAPGL